VFHLYGPYEAPQRFVSSVICSMLDGAPARCSSGLQQRDLLHVDDVAAAFALLLLAKLQGPVNVASGDPVALADVAGRIARIIGSPSLLQLGALPDRPNDPPLLAGDNRALSAIGWQPSFTLDEGIAATVQWWRGRCT